MSTDEPPDRGNTQNPQRDPEIEKSLLLGILRAYHITDTQLEIAYRIYEKHPAGINVFGKPITYTGDLGFGLEIISDAPLDESEVLSFAAGIGLNHPKWSRDRTSCTYERNGVTFRFRYAPPSAPSQEPIKISLETLVPRT